MSAFLVREAAEQDLAALLELYTQLHDNPLPDVSDRILRIYDGILRDENHHILLGCADGIPVSSCVLVLVPNLTHGQQPYALVENVVTHRDFRRKGYAARVLDHARQIAAGENCYKIMLMTGSKSDSTLRFYEKAGYNRLDKTAFIQWL